jgi:hypothetical protein
VLIDSAVPQGGFHAVLAGHDPTHFMYELVPDADRVARRRELIFEFHRVCNM